MAISLPKNTGPGVKIYLAPLCSSLLLIPAFPRFEQGYLAWFALIPFLWFCFNVSPRQAAVGGLLFGLPLSLYLNYYLVTLFFNYLSPCLAIFSSVALITVVNLFSIFFAVGASFIRRSFRPFTLTLAIPSLWVALEYMRSVGFLGYNVGYLGYTQWHYPFLLNLAATYGYWGLPFTMVAFQCLLLLALTGQLRGEKLFMAAAIWFALLAGGLLLPCSFPYEPPPATAWVALIQGNSSPEEVLSVKGREQILNRYMRLTRLALAEQPLISLVVWPETIVDLAGPEISHEPSMIYLARNYRVNFLYGAKTIFEEKRYNSIAAINADGSETATYHKRRLVPFVEYFPVENLLNSILNLEVGLGEYTVGAKETTLFDFSGIPLAGVICYESYFGDYTRRFARDGARHLFILTNDAWFENSISLEQHAQVAAFRAAESGIGVTQVANGGITILFDYLGNEIHRSPKLTEDTVITLLNPEGRHTLYRRWGDYFPALCGFFLAGLAGVFLHRRLK